MSRGLRRPEALIVAGIVVLAAILLTTYKVTRVDLLRGDTAQQLSATESIASRGLGWSNVTASVIDFSFTRKIPTMPPAFYATDPLNAPKDRETDLLGFHSYYILYPLAILTTFVPSIVVLLAADVLSFLGIVALAYLLLRRCGIPIAPALLFCLLIVSTPVWGLGILYGQFYPDQLYLLLGFAFIYLAQGGVEKRYGLLAAAVLCAMIDERAALVSGIVLAAYCLLFWKSTGDRYFKIGLAAALFCYGEFVVTFLLTNPEYPEFFPHSIATLVHRYSRPVYVDAVGVFLLVNLPLLALAFVRWRWGVLSLFMMLPNIFGTVGGGEKIGWSTHYHASYFPILVMGMLYGVVDLWHRIPERRRLVSTCAVLLAIALCVATGNRVSAADPDLGLSNIANSFPATFPGDVLGLLSPGSTSAIAAARAMQQVVPEGSVVTAVEAAMPILYHGRTIEFFPIDIDRADYAVMTIEGADGGRLRLGGVVAPFSPADMQGVEDVLRKRMAAHGYDLAHPAVFPRMGLAVVRRVDGKTKPFPPSLQPARNGAATSSLRPAAVPRAVAERTAYPLPPSRARIVQHRGISVAAGASSPEIVGKLLAKPVPGHLLLAFASSGFGCTPAPGWTLAGTDPSNGAAVAYRVATSSDTARLTPFTTPRQNGYTLELLEIDGDPAIVASAEAGGRFSPTTVVANRLSLAVPQRRGLLLQLYAGTGSAGGNGAPVAYASTIPAGQAQKLVDRMQASGNAFELIVQAVTSEPLSAPQPFAVEQRMTFSRSGAPGNMVAGWLVWIGGRRG